MNLRLLPDLVLLQIGQYLSINEYFNLEDVIQRPIPCPLTIHLDNNYEATSDASTLLQRLHQQRDRVRGIVFDRVQPMCSSIMLIQSICFFVGLTCLDLNQHMLLESEIIQLLSELNVLQMFTGSIWKVDCCSTKDSETLDPKTVSPFLTQLEIVYVYSDYCFCSKSLLLFIAKLSQLRKISFINSKGTEMLSSSKELIFEWSSIEYIKLNADMLPHLERSLRDLTKLKEIIIVGESYIFIDTKIFIERGIRVFKESLPFKIGYLDAEPEVKRPIGQIVVFDSVESTLNEISASSEIQTLKIKEGGIGVDYHPNISMKLKHLQSFVICLNYEDHPNANIAKHINSCFIEPSANTLENLVLDAQLMVEIKNKEFSLPRLSNLTLTSESNCTKNISLNGITVNICKKSSQNLNCLFLRNIPFDLSCLNELLTHCIDLKELHIQCQCDEFSGDCFEALKLAPVLTTFSLVTDKTIDSNIFKTFTKCSKLSYIFLEVVGISSDYVLNSCVQQIPKLLFFAVIKTGARRSQSNVKYEEQSLIQGVENKVAFSLNGTWLDVQRDISEKYKNFYYVFWQRRSYYYRIYDILHDHDVFSEPDYDNYDSEDEM